MRNHQCSGYLLAGLCAGIVNGLFGAGGGMVLIPLLRKMTDLEEDAVFPTCVTMILPMCIMAIVITGLKEPLSWAQSLPYLIGGGIGGCFAGKYGSKIPVSWLHRTLGIMILWGGFRNLC